MRGKAGAVCAILCGAAALAAPGIARADIGIQGPAYVAGTSGPPTTSKPESKLWFNDGAWWASMAAPTSSTDNDYHVFKLVGNTWTDTGTPIDTRPSTRQDVLSVGSSLFVASHKFDSTPVFKDPSTQVGDEMRLYRFNYSGGTYALAFSVNIDPQEPESLVIDQAADGKIWATWVQQDGVGGPYRVFYSHTNGDCSTAAMCDFTPRAPVPGSTAVAADDISSLIRFNASNIGIMWSDQIASAYKFVVASPSFGSIVNASSGPSLADDHLNLKAFEGKVYAATKTKFDSKTTPNPQTRLLVRNTSGSWTAHTISFSPDQRTRPIVLLDTENRVIHVFETGPHPSGANTENGGNIFESTSDLDNINFAVLSRRPVIEDSDSPGMNNATSTKGSVNSTTDVPVLATNDLTKRYWHHFETLTAPPPPPPPPPTGPCSISGTSGPDIINGTGAADVICGFGGNDIIRGFGGGDRLLGGVGNDVLVGGLGADRLFGQGGADRLLGVGSNDALVGGLGADRLLGGAANDVLAGGIGRDRLLGGLGRDRLVGWTGNDTLVGGVGKDTHLGGGGRDTIYSRDTFRELVSGGLGFDRARVNRSDVRRSIERLF